MLLLLLQALEDGVRLKVFNPLLVDDADVGHVAEGLVVVKVVAHHERVGHAEARVVRLEALLLWVRFSSSAPTRTEVGPYFASSGSSAVMVRPVSMMSSNTITSRPASERRSMPVMVTVPVLSVPE